MGKFQYHKQNINLSITFLFTACLFFGGCTSQVMIKDQAVQAIEVDPYENFNRKIFIFNKKLNDYVIKPISDTYTFLTPKFVQTRIHNFFDNLQNINSLLNNVMQGKARQGIQDVGRLAINSTIGLAGLFDVATKVGLEKHNEDFAQTLAVWGVPQGPYLVLPIVGPLTGRGIPGGVFDLATNPINYIYLPVQVIRVFDIVSNAEVNLKFIDEASLDAYIFTRESFLQFRKHLINDGNYEITNDLFYEYEL